MDAKVQLVMLCVSVRWLGQVRFCQADDEAGGINPRRAERKPGNDGVSMNVSRNTMWDTGCQR